MAQLSLIERGRQQPSVRSSWGPIRTVLGIAEALPREAWERKVEITDELVATLGACLAAVRQATLAELAEASQASIAEVRLALRRLSERVEPVGMQVSMTPTSSSWHPCAALGRRWGS